MEKLKLGEIYFLELPGWSNKISQDKPVVGSATIDKIGRKYATFSSLYNRTDEYYLKNYRYNLTDNTIELLRGPSEWRVFSRQVFDNPKLAAVTAEREILINCLLSSRKESAIRELSLDMLRALESCLDLSVFNSYRLKQLREVKNPPRTTLGAPARAQINLGQLIELLEAVENQELPVRFAGLDYNSQLDLNSWRGSYSELSLSWDRSVETTLVCGLLAELKSAVDKIFYGWKGGEYLIERSTPLWVANLGTSGGFLPQTDECRTQAIVGITVLSDVVEIDSAICEFTKA